MIPVALAAKLLPIRAVLAKVPRVVWLALAAVLVLWAGWSWHKRTVAAADRAGFERGVTTTQAAYRKALAEARTAALKRRAQQEARAAAITKELNDETARLRARIRTDADRLLEQGPGRAACTGRSDHPGIPGGTGTTRPGGARDAEVAPVPSAERVDLIGLPFTPTVAFAYSHDALRAYYLADQEWHRRQAAEWEKGRR